MEVEDKRGTVVLLDGFLVLLGPGESTFGLSLIEIVDYLIQLTHVIIYTCLTLR